MTSVYGTFHQTGEWRVDPDTGVGELITTGYWSFSNPYGLVGLREPSLRVGESRTPSQLLNEEHEAPEGGAVAGGSYGMARGAAYGLRIGLAEAKHLPMVMRLMPISEGAGAGAFGGLALGGPYGSLIGLGLGGLYELGNMGIDAIESRRSVATPDHSTTCVAKPKKAGH